MKRFRVELSPSAADQAERIHTWWAANRTSSPALFLRELAAALRYLTLSPRGAPRYEGDDIPKTRRVLLPRSRYHVYFTLDEGARIVRVYALWHASRGGEPR